MRENRFQKAYLYALGYRDEVSIGDCYRLGKFVPRNLDLAKQYLYIAAMRNEAQAFNILGEIAREEGEMGFFYYYKGIMFESWGELRSAIDSYEKAATYYTPINVMYKIGQLYARCRLDKILTDREVKKDKEKELYWYRRAAAWFDKDAINYLDSESSKDPEVAYVFGEMFEKGEIGNYERKIADKSIKIPRAIEYYIIAIKQGYKLALDALERLQKYWSEDVTLEIAKTCHTIFKEPGKAVQYIELLIAINYLPAFSELEKIGNIYPPCAYKLGQIHEERARINAEPAIQYTEAVKWYFAAARLGYDLAINALEKLRTYRRLNDNALLELGRFYRDRYNKELLALFCFKQISDKESITASKEIQLTINKSSDAAFAYGQLLEDELAVNQSRAPDFTEIIQAYMVACRSAHKQSLQAIERLEYHLNDEMRLELAKLYYYRFDNVNEALVLAKKLADKENAEAKRFMHLIIDKSGRLTYVLATMYTDEGNHDEATVLYIQAVIKRDIDALAFIEKLEDRAKSGEAQAQYELGRNYFHVIADFKKAIDWCLLAAEQNYKPAIIYLDSYTFNDRHYNYIARLYELGDGVKKSLTLAIRFYQKGLDQNNAESAYQLAELYLGLTESDDEKQEVAFRYFIQAAFLDHQDALITLERLGHEVEPKLQILLGDMYQHKHFNNQSKAIYWYQEAANGGSDEANQYLCTIQRPRFG